MINAQNPYAVGTKVIIKINGNRVTGTVVGFDSQLNCPRVEFQGRTFSRRVYGVADAATTVLETNLPSVPSDNVPSDNVPSVAPAPEWDINQRFSFIDMMIDMLIKSEGLFSMILTGTGGLGKSTTVMNAVRRHGLVEDEDYAVVKGFATPKSLFRLLYENRDKIVVFDDCDSVLENPSGFNILKAALDDKPRRRISWFTEARSSGDDEVPNSFEFTGKVIFVSNKKLSSFDPAILSRALFVDVTMTADEKIQRIETLVANGSLAPDVHETAKLEALNLLRRMKHRAKELSLRTYKKVLEMRLANPNFWTPMAEYMLVAGPEVE